MPFIGSCLKWFMQSANSMQVDKDVRSAATALSDGVSVCGNVLRSGVSA